MKLATFIQAGTPVIGSVDTTAGTILDLRGAHRALFGSDHAALGDMLALMDAGDQGLDLARRVIERAGSDASHRHPLASTKLLSPVPEPRYILDFNNFEQHMRDAPFGIAKLKARIAGQPEPERAKFNHVIPEVSLKQPTYYTANRFNVVGQDAEIEWPSFSEWIDYEAEFAAFVGKKGKNIPKNRAAEHIFGYAIFNDFSARDRQAREMEGWMGPAKGKSFDTGNAIGPWIVTRDEVPDSRGLAVKVRINGKEVGNSTTRGMIHSFEDIIAFLSVDETLQVGSVYGSGTIGGCCGLESGHWLKANDLVEVEFERLGVLRNRVVRK
jgi:2-keto-4-pentenoate hydratase/2-oxohepta-3-ene-1,7-dioic acid hydratase in catechol pathway